MRIIAFFKLVRWPNLLFIALTQILFYLSVIRFVHGSLTNVEPVVTTLLLFLIIAASLLIAAAGYIINDYFDLNIDLVNKPERLIVDKYIKRRWAIFFHIFFSFIGLVISAYVGWKLRNWYIPLLNFFVVVALWFYSTTLKKKLLVGNVLISLLTSWVILILTLAEYRYLHGTVKDLYLSTRLLKVSFIYAGFAFIISLVREVVKDMEDMPGDAKYGCKTMPIVWGIPVSKVFAAVWISVLIGALVIIQFYVWQLGKSWTYSVIYSVLLIILPLIFILKKLYEAHLQTDYHRLSTMIKVVMFTGILSMIFFL